VLAAYKCKVNNVYQQFRRNSCLKYKCELEEMAEELTSVRKIIQLFQDNLSTFKNFMLTSKSDERSNSHMISKLTNKWKIVTDKSSQSIRKLHEQMPIPVIPITNRYNALHNLQNDLEVPGALQNHHIKNHHIKKNVPSKQNKTKTSPKRRKKKILLIGDIVIHVVVPVNLGST
jgi:dTDP-4-amino-4,6-dideoxygalactose transaminase